MWSACTHRTASVITIPPPSGLTRLATPPPSGLTRLATPPPPLGSPDWPHPLPLGAHQTGHTPSPSGLTRLAASSGVMMSRKSTPLLATSLYENHGADSGSSSSYTEAC